MSFGLFELVISVQLSTASIKHKINFKYSTKFEKTKAGKSGKEKAFHLLNNIPGELAFADRKSVWRRQQAGKPVLITLLPLLDLASARS